MAVPSATAAPLSGAGSTWDISGESVGCSSGPPEKQALARAIAAYVSKAESLTALDLSCNSFCGMRTVTSRVRCWDDWDTETTPKGIYVADGVIAIAEALRGNRALERLTQEIISFRISTIYPDNHLRVMGVQAKKI